MASPNAARRRQLARQGKANPDGSYPTDTRGRAIAAKGRARHAEKVGRISARKESLIDARADRELGDYHGPGKHGHNAKSRTGKTRSWMGR